jgi:CelD/BcsL family acetyltransferase involved in cellulose biosynthesis
MYVNGEPGANALDSGHRMKIRTISANQLSSADIAAWSAIQLAHVKLASPYFRPEFTQLVGAVRGDVEVAVLEDGGSPVGFFPFQRNRFGMGRPVGNELNDCAGLIAAPDVELDARELLRACGLKTWHFDNVLASQRLLAPHCRRESCSSHIDLAAGFDAYLAHRTRRGRLMQNYRRYMRMMTAEVGPVRYEVDCRDPGYISKLLDWKRDQIRREHLPNICEFTWVHQLLETVLKCESPHFVPLLSVTFAGGRIAAIQLMLRTGDVAHGWFMSYDRELSRYSPGFLALIESLKAACALGIRRLELGKGPEEFKKNLRNGTTPMCEGAIDCGRTTAALRSACWQAARIVRASPFSSPARGVARQVRRARHWVVVKMANFRQSI